MIAKAELVPTRMELTGSQRALLEERLQRARQGSSRPRESRPSIPRRPTSDPIPLSSAQERLWFLDQLEPGSAVYNVWQAVRLKGALDLGVLERALNEIVRRHEILRTNFVAQNGTAVQVIAPERTLPFVVADLGARPESEREAAVRARLEEESRLPFDLAHDVLVRALLVRSHAAEHTLMVTMHHIISDGWSVGVLFRELGALYAAYTRGEAPALPELPVQFADYVVWERQQLQGPALEKPLAYWKTQLAGPLPVLELPFDKARPSTPSSRGAVQTAQISRPLTQALKELGQKESATLFMTLLAAFQVLLHRWTGQDDLVVGSVVAGRQKVELEKLIGFFVNTLVFRGHLEGDPTFLELLGRTRTVAFGAFAHQEVPFERLVKELRPDRAASRNPLFQVMFALQNAPMAASELPGLAVESVDIDSGTAKFDLTLVMIEGPQGLRAAFEYHADLFEPATIARLLRSLETLLEDIVANPHQRIGDLALMSGSERQRLLVDWNRTAAAYPDDVPIHVLFERQAARAPDATALVAGKQTLTYRELNARANQLARRLRQMGVQPDVPVALCLERSPEMIVALLGILKAGGAYLSLDPSYPAERLAYMLADAQVSLVVTVEALARALPPQAGAAQLVRLDRDRTSIEREDTSDLPPALSARHLAYISYTSGSTGRPKGVCIEHRSVARLVLGTDYLQLTPTDTIAQMSNCAFDASTWEIWGALLNGARLAIVPPAVVLSPREFAALVEREGVTALLLTTALFNQMAQTLPEFFRTLRAVLFGGEAANPACVRTILRRGYGVRLLNVYGPTEVTSLSTCHDVRDVPEDAASVPIGRPIANTTAYVLDARRRPVPVGVPGELYLGGDGLARGYLHRPELTAERFVPHPFVEASHGEAQRLYRTGDRVRWREDGTLEFLGRCDRQVKMRGFRIEPGEIEQALLAHPAVQQAVVAVHTPPVGERQLVAYVAPALSRDDVRRHLQVRLPDYMVPAAFVFLEALPINGNGKIDRAALPAPDRAARTAYCAPRDEVERQLAGVWQTVLGVENAGVHDGFFDLGGHSLLAIRMVAEIEKSFGKKLPVAAIFQHGTIDQLAPLLRASGQAYVPRSSIVAIQPQGTRPPVYFVHGVGGGMFWGYGNLARHLGPEQPVSVFKSRGLDGLPEWPTIEEMAASYVADLRAHQPAGPYVIGGYCFGGIVAYEMARQLRAAGQDVALLALINCSPPNSDYLRVPSPRPLAWHFKFVRNLAYWFGCFLFRWTWRERLEFVRWKARLLRKRTLRPGIFGGSEIAVTDVDEMVNLAAYSEDQRRLWQTHVQALGKYRPQPYSGRVALFRSRGHPFLCSFDEQYGWSDLIAHGFTQWIVPGGHGNILEEPNAATVARELAQELAGLAGEPPAAPAPAKEVV